MQIQTCPKFGGCVCVCAWAHSQRGCWALWDWEERERYQCSFYKDPKTSSRSTFIWKSSTSLGFLVIKPSILPQTGCRTFSNGLIQERGWLRPVLPVQSGLCPVLTHVWCRERIFLPLWFHFRVQRVAAACLLQHISLHSLPACRVVMSWKEALEKISKEFATSPMKQLLLWSCICSITPIYWLAGHKLFSFVLWGCHSFQIGLKISWHLPIVSFWCTLLASLNSFQQASSVCLCSSFYLAGHHALRIHPGQCLPVPSPKAHNFELSLPRGFCISNHVVHVKFHVKRMADWRSGSFVEAWSFNNFFLKVVYSLETKVLKITVKLIFFKYQSKKNTFLVPWKAGLPEQPNHCRKVSNLICRGTWPCPLKVSSGFISKDRASKRAVMFSLQPSFSTSEKTRML